MSASCKPKGVVDAFAAAASAHATVVRGGATAVNYGAAVAAAAATTFRKFDPLPGILS